MPSFTNPLIDTSGSDYELARRVAAFLGARHSPGLRRLHVEARNGVVTLSGRVGSFYEKQLGRHGAERVAGVRQVIDAIEVVRLPREAASRPTAIRFRQREVGRPAAARSPVEIV